ncbi:CRISPR-associated protein (Cas_Csy3) [Oceanospirillum linum]|nr:CRISPR-associated protein (Cas_Csy3) [Oleiphilus messinensis]SMP22490.1 CRISPR-associated protein (Cas_Csy3) [Oceanospirillum linum]
MTADKVNAAIQRVDNWYSDDPNASPLRVNEYGSDSHRNIACRHPSTQLDFYTLLQGIDEQISVLEKAKSLKDIPASTHYITSVLTKGGMFQGGKAK